LVSELIIGAVAWSVERDTPGDDADADGVRARSRTIPFSSPLAAPPAAVPVTPRCRRYPLRAVVCRRAHVGVARAVSIVAARSDEGCDEVAFVEAGSVSSRREQRRG
jgi:hypothetical protein